MNSAMSAPLPSAEMTRAMFMQLALPYLSNVDELDRRHVDADRASQRHHGILVFRDTLELARRQLDDPRTADALGGNGQTLAGIVDGRKLELHAGKRKTERILPNRFTCTLAPFIAGERRRFPAGRPDGDRPGQVPAECPEEKELALGIDPGPLREIPAQPSFGQQVGKERLDACPYRAEIRQQLVYRMPLFSACATQVRIVSDIEYSEEVHLGAQGRLVVPARLRRRLGLQPGDALIARSDQGRLVVEKAEVTKQRLKARYARVPENRSLAKELLEERREEAKRESGR